MMTKVTVFSTNHPKIRLRYSLFLRAMMILFHFHVAIVSSLKKNISLPMKHLHSSTVLVLIVPKSGQMTTNIFLKKVGIAVDGIFTFETKRSHAVKPTKSELYSRISNYRKS